MVEAGARTLVHEAPVVAAAEVRLDCSYQEGVEAAEPTLGEVEEARGALEELALQGPKQLLMW